MRPVQEVHAEMRRRIAVDTGNFDFWACQMRSGLQRVLARLGHAGKAGLGVVTSWSEDGVGHGTHGKDLDREAKKIASAEPARCVAVYPNVALYSVSPGVAHSSSSRCWP